MWSLQPRPRARASVDRAGVALATVAALGPGAAVAVALHAHAAAAVDVVRVVGDEGAAVRKLDPVAGDAEGARVALAAEARRRQRHAGVHRQPAARMRHLQAVTADAEGARVALATEARRRQRHAGVHRQPAARMRHLQAVTADAAVLAVALHALLLVVERVAAVVVQPGARMRHLQAVAVDAEPRVVLEMAAHADGLAAAQDDGAVSLVPALRVRHLQAVVALGAEGAPGVALGALAGRDVQLHRDLGGGRRDAADVAQVAVVGELLAVVAAGTDRHLVLRDARHLELRAGVRDVGVAGEALVAGLAQPLVVDADAADHEVLLDLAVEVTLGAGVGAHVGGDGAFVSVRDVEDQVGRPLQVADEVVEDAVLGVALLATHAGLVVGGALVRVDLGLDDVAGLAGVDAVHRREADDRGHKEHDERRQYPQDPAAGDTDLEEHAALGGLALGHGSVTGPGGRRWGRYRRRVLDAAEQPMRLRVATAVLLVAGLAVGDEVAIEAGLGALARRRLGVLGDEVLRVGHGHLVARLAVVLGLVALRAYLRAVLLDPLAVLLDPHGVVRHLDAAVALGAGVLLHVTGAAGRQQADRTVVLDPLRAVVRDGLVGVVGLRVAEVALRRCHLAVGGLVPVVVAEQALVHARVRA